MGTDGVMTIIWEPFTLNCEYCLLNFTSFNIVFIIVSGVDSSDLLNTTTYNKSHHHSQVSPSPIETEGQ